MPLNFYSKTDFINNARGNLFGGVTAAVVALPLALAFGISSGAGPLAGLYGAIVVGLFAAILGGTRSQISGPTGPMTVVMSAMIAQYLSEYPKEGMALAFTTVFLAGLLQILMGAFRLGKYIIMVPYPVVSGFMSGIGAIIIILQVAPLLGFAGESSVLRAIEAMAGQFASANSSALLLGSGSLALLFLWRGKANRVMPAPLLVLVFATLAAQLLFADDALRTIGKIPSALPQFHWPVFERDLLHEIAVNATMLAVLGAIDSLLTSLVADNLSGDIHDSNQELIGQGIGNSLAGLIGALPGAGATMRTVVNIRAGGSGPLSGTVHALVLFSAVIGLGFLFENIPLAALSAVLIKVGIDIIDWPFLARIRQLPRFTVGLMMIVLLLTVFVDLITAVFVGVFIKNMMLLDRLSDIELGNITITDDLPETPLSLKQQNLLKQQDNKTKWVKLTGPLSYAVNRRLMQRFNEMEYPSLLIIDLSSASLIGVTTALSIEKLIQSAQQSGSQVVLIDHIKHERKEFHQLGILNLIGENNCFDDINAVITQFS